MISELTDYAKNELTRAGLFDKDSDYEGMLDGSAMQIVELFSEQGHSGVSAAITIGIIEKPLRYEPLTPLTYEPDEWNDVSGISGTPMWQNKRNPSVFSVDGGKTHYSLEEPTNA